MENEFRAQVEGDAILIAVQRSRMDAASAPRFKDVVAAVWTDSLKSAAVDMSAVDFIDSSGVGALLSVLRRLPQGEGTVTLRSMKPQVLSVIELLRLHRVFQIAD